MANVVLRSFSGNGSQTLTDVKQYNGFSIVNDGMEALSFSVGGVTITVQANETFEGNFLPFTSVTITCNSSVYWRAYFANELILTNSYGSAPSGIKVSEFINLVRFGLSDVENVRFSDYEILTCTNIALRLMNNALSNLNSTLITKSATLLLDNKQATLPVDFKSIVYVEDVGKLELAPRYNNQELTSENYQIVGNTIMSDNSAINIIYRYVFQHVTSPTQYIPIDDSLVDLLARYCMLFVRKEINQGDSAVITMLQQEVNNYTRSRERTYIERESLYW